MQWTITTGKRGKNNRGHAKLSYLCKVEVVYLIVECCVGIWVL